MNSKKSVLYAILSLAFAMLTLAIPAFIGIGILGFAVCYTVSLSFSRLPIILSPIFIAVPIIMQLSPYFCIIPIIIILGCILASELIKRKLDFKSVVIATGGGISILSLISGGGFVFIKTGKVSYDAIISLLLPYKEPLQNNINQIFNTYKAAGINLNGIDADKFNTMFVEFIKNILIILLPGIIVAASFILCFVVIIFVKRILYRANISTNLGLASDFELTRTSVWVYIIAMILQIFVTNQIFAAAIVNFYLVISSLFFLSGISIIAFMLRNIKSKPFVRIIIYVVLAILIILGFFELISFIGVFSCIFKVRERYKVFFQNKK